MLGQNKCVKSNFIIDDAIDNIGQCIDRYK